MSHPHSLTPFPWIDVILVVILIILNGAFAMAEIAIVSAKRARLHAMERRGITGAKTALALGDDPGKFLSTIQIGITLIAIGVGIFSGANFESPIMQRLMAMGLTDHFAKPAAFILVVGIVTLITLIFGELVPKQIALHAAERIAASTARPMMLMSRVLKPLVWGLEVSSAAILGLLGFKAGATHLVTADELHLMVSEAHRSGLIEENERAIMAGVVRLADRPVREIMTPRTEIAWININATLDEARKALAEMRHLRLLVADGSIDNVLGVLVSHDVMTALLRGQVLDLRALIRPAPIIPDQIDAMNALETLRASDVPLALVHDEYGHFEGIVTPADLLAALVSPAAIADPDDGEPAFTDQPNGALLVAGWTPADMLAEKLDLLLPEDRDYATVAGFVLAQLKRIPDAGDHFTTQGHVFEVVRLDGRKIEQVRVRAVADTPAS